MWQIAQKRQGMALKRLKGEPTVALLFVKEKVSAWEDQPTKLKPIRVNPVWWSAKLATCAHKLDEITMRMSKTAASRKATCKLLERDGERSNKNYELHDVPRKLPLDAYDRAFLAGLLELDKQYLAPRKDINLAKSAKELTALVCSNPKPPRAITVEADICVAPIPVGTHPWPQEQLSM